MTLEVTRRTFAAATLSAAMMLSPSVGSAQDTVLRLQTFGGDAQLKAAQDAVARFEAANPGVTVDIAIDPISNGWGEFVTKVYAQFNSGNSFDVYHTAIETFSSFASRGLMQGLNERLPTLADVDDFDPSFFEMSAYKGETYYIPSTWNNIMVNYNRALFDEAGVDYPKAGWNWDDFTETAVALTKRDDAGSVSQFGYEVPSQFFFVQPWFFSNGTGILNADWTASNMDDPKVTETLQYLYDLIHVHGVSPVPAAGTMDNQFFAGQVAMIARGHWIVQNAISSGMDMDVAIPPAKVQDSTVIGFGGYGISRDTEHGDLAWALINELVGIEAQISEGELGGAVPGRKSAAETEAFLEFPPSSELYYATVPNTQPVPSPANFQEVSEIFMRHYIAMMSGEETIEEGTAAAHAELTRSFERLARVTGQ